MRTTLIAGAAIGVIGFVLGARATRPTVLPRESVRHQVERLWNDPKARKARERRIEQLRRTAKETAKQATKDARKGAKRAKRRARALAR